MSQGITQLTKTLWLPIGGFNVSIDFLSTLGSHDPIPSVADGDDPTVSLAEGLAGAFAGAISVLATMPQDTVKTRMQGRCDAGDAGDARDAGGIPEDFAESWWK